MRELAKKIASSTRSPTAKLVKQRLCEFKELGKKGNKNWFSELCFCILTANSTAAKGMQIQQALGAKCFLNLPEKQLAKKLKALGHRFYNKRAEFIAAARKHRKIKDKILSFKSERDARDWLAENVLGIGYKEASHFLRNVGFENLAILDRHVLLLMKEHGLLKKKPKSFNRKKYLEAEKALDALAKKTGLPHAELDLYLWFLKTGKVLK